MICFFYSHIQYFKYASILSITITQIHIQLLRSFNTNTTIFNRPMLMLEPRGAYLDPPRQAHHHLASLCAETMSMTEQLVYVSRQPQAPAYFTSAGHKTVYLTRKPTVQLTIGGADDAPWPTQHATMLGFNAGQLAAVQHALTNRVALIQGPPGTGKSFVGQHIAGLLCQNTALRIVVISYTNLALDQFLHDLVRTGYDNCRNVVRMGGQCTNTALKPYVLRQYNSSSDQQQQSRTANARINGRLYQHHLAIHAMNQALLATAQSIGSANGDATLREAALQSAIVQSVSARDRLEELRQLADYEEIKDRQVVGMTSSFAARNGTLLQLLQAPISE